MIKILAAIAALAFTTPALAAGEITKSTEVGGMLTSIFGGLTGGGPMHEMFANFNAVVLFFGSIVISYTVLTSIMATAHDGEVLGKKLSSVWVPLRSAGAIALLLPTAGGFSLIQIIVLSLAAFGSDMGSAVWQKTVPLFQSGAPGIGDLVPATTKIDGSTIAPLAVAGGVRCMSEHDRALTATISDSAATATATAAGINSTLSDSITLRC